MAIKNDEKELHELYSDVDGNKIVLPNFQRGFVWDRKKQRSLLASLLVGLPIGSLLLLDGNHDDFSKRRLCYPQELSEAEGECQYVLDGQQRLSTLRVVLYDVFSEENDWQTAFESLYGPLRTRWFIRVVPEDTSEQDIFGYRSLSRIQLDKYIDSDIEDFVEYRVVHKNKKGEPHHPAYRPDLGAPPSSHQKAELRFEVAKALADDGLVPLWEVSHRESGLHRTVLQYIVDEKLRQLKNGAELHNHDIAYYDKVFEPLGLAPGVLDRQLFLASQEGYHTALATQWAQLSTKWVESVATQLEALLRRKMHYTHMTRDEVDRAVAVFEAINRGGTPLSVYDLIVAKSARDKRVVSRVLCKLLEDGEVLRSQRRGLPGLFHLQGDEAQDRVG